MVDGPVVVAVRSGAYREVEPELDLRPRPRAARAAVRGRFAISAPVLG